MNNSDHGRWTAHRMWVELQSLGIEVGESTVRELVRNRKRARKQVFVPLDFGPGERAEFDFGHAQVILAGRRVELPFLVGRLRFSGAMYAEFFPTERQDAFLLDSATLSSSGAACRGIASMTIPRQR